MDRVGYVDAAVVVTWKSSECNLMLDKCKELRIYVIE